LPFNTDERLKSRLDSRLLDRERMCLAVLANDRRFTNVTPRHPRGGPDGGRDIQAIFRNDQLAFGAVGFVNQASDSSKEQKRTIKSKFKDDLMSALNADTKPTVFVFFTNINLTVREKEALVSQAIKAGLANYEIFDREQIRIALDNADGFAIRFQYLGIPLSKPEQVSFFAKWGDDIQSIISTGFQRVEKTLERVLFLQEAADVLSGVTLRFELDRNYPAEEIGHFRAFCDMCLKEPKLKIFGVMFGCCDKSRRMEPEFDPAAQRSGIKYGISSGQWEEHIDLEAKDDPDKPDEKSEPPEYKQVGSGGGRGMDSVEFISASYRHDPHFFRFWPRLKLLDIDQAWLMPILNKSLAEKVKAIHVYANGYKLYEAARSEFSIDNSSFDPKIPAQFSPEELADPWVRIRPKGLSTFVISFSERTPRRLFASPQTPDSLAPNLLLPHRPT
jgi:hypothetical protein